MYFYRQNTIVAAENENPPLMPAIMTPAGTLDLQTVLLGNRVIFIGQYINSQVAHRVISQLVTLAAVDEEADILVSMHFRSSFIAVQYGLQPPHVSLKLFFCFLRSI
jgi:hypothetical protein